MPAIDENIELNMPELTKSKVNSQSGLDLPAGNMIQIYTHSGSHLEVDRTAEIKNKSKFGVSQEGSSKYNSKFSNRTEMFDIYSNKYHTEDQKKNQPVNPFGK